MLSLLLKDLFAHTWEEHPDYEHIKRGLEKLQVFIRAALFGIIFLSTTITPNPGANVSGDCQFSQRRNSQGGVNESSRSNSKQPDRIRGCTCITVAETAVVVLFCFALLSGRPVRQKALVAPSRFFVKEGPLTRCKLDAKAVMPSLHFVIFLSMTKTTGQNAQGVLRLSLQ